MSASVFVVDWHLRKHERTPSDTYNHCSEARHRAAIFVLMTSLPSLLVSVFMFWLGYSIEPASDLQWCVFSVLYQPMFWQVFLQNRLPTCALAFKYEIYPFSLYLWSSLSLSLQPCILLHWLTSLFAGTWLYTHCIYAPHLNNQLSHLDTVSLQHTDLRVFERERSIQCQEIDWCLL